MEIADDSIATAMFTIQRMIEETDAETARQALLEVLPTVKNEVIQRAIRIADFSNCAQCLDTLASDGEER